VTKDEAQRRRWTFYEAVNLFRRSIMCYHCHVAKRHGNSKFTSLRLARDPKSIRLGGQVSKL
jgi:hypothetical protein